MIHHIGFSVGDVARAEAEFYVPVLAFLGYQRVDGGPDRARFWRDPSGGPTLHLVAEEGAFAPPKSDHCAFRVSSRDRVDDLHALLLEREIGVLSPPADYPHFGHGHYAVFFHDPNGRLFEVLHRPPASASSERVGSGSGAQAA
jgi:catechol 2,3-dioxygenase-like lactoylglutathione lyase family enzyme